MNEHDANEQRYRNGYDDGYKDGYEAGKHDSVKYGQWVIHSHGKDRKVSWAECSECRTCGSPEWKCCPVCETKMGGIRNEHG